MHHRLCLSTALIALAGCSSSGDDSAVAGPVAIRVPALGSQVIEAPRDDASASTTPEAIPSTMMSDTVTSDEDSSTEDTALPEGPGGGPVPVSRQTALAADGTPLPPEAAVRLRSIFDIANGDAIEFAVAVARRLVDVEVGPHAGFTFSRRGTDEETGIEDVTLLCPEGGTLDTTSANLLSTDGQFTLNQCAIGPLVLDGVIKGRVRGPDRENDGEIVVEPSYSFRNFTLRDTRDGRTIAIAVGKVAPGGVPVAPTVRFGYGTISSYGSDKLVGAGSLFDERGGRSVTTLGTMVTRTRSNATIDFPLGGMTTAFGVRFGPEPKRVDVETVVPFGGLDPQGHFALGSLTVTAEDYVYTLDADDGDPTTFRLDITEDAVTTAWTVPWSEAFGFDAFAPEDVDVGF